jgi:hypothetical protein
MARRCRLSPSAERIWLAAILAATFGVRALRADQPIVENYVGRQIPTAMVARNLDRGSGFLWPQLDTEPRPNYFLVEPPVYELFPVALHRGLGLDLEPAGRLVSTLGIVLAAWGLFGLTRKREGPLVALVAAAIFAVLPVTIRYGRSFQGDALMLGSLVAALRCFDESESLRGRTAWFACGWALLAGGLAIKITSSYMFVPLVFAIFRPPRAGKIALAALALLPALLWYVHVATMLRTGQSGSASAQNAAIWAHALVPTAWLNKNLYVLIFQFLFIRAFTPIGCALAFLGLARPAQRDRLWTTWALAAAGALAVLAAKLHHEYYFLALAPIAAVCAARALGYVAGRAVWGPWAAGCAALCLVLLGAAQSASTWRTPPEWAGLREAAEIVKRYVPLRQTLIAPEALLYYADRPGYRLELDPAAARRAAQECGFNQLDAEAQLHKEDVAVALLRFYRIQGARYFADVQGAFEGPRRSAVHRFVRESSEPAWTVLEDRPQLMLLAGPGVCASKERAPLDRTPSLDRGLAGRSPTDPHSPVPAKN